LGALKAYIISLFLDPKREKKPYNFKEYHRPPNKIKNGRILILKIRI